MKISDIRIKLVEKDDKKLKAFASMTIEDCFVVHDIKVIEGKDGYFVSMPSKKKPDGTHTDIVHPINTETRTMINDLIIEAFKNAPRD